MSQLNDLKTKIFLFSFGLGVISTIGLFNANNNIKDIAKTGMGSALASVVLSEILTGKATTIINKTTSETELLLKSRNAELSEVAKKATSEVSKLTGELTGIKALASRLEREVLEGKSILDNRANQLSQANNSLSELKTKLHNVGKFSSDEAYKIVKNTYDRSMKKLEGQLDALSRNYPAVGEELQPVYFEADKLRARYLKKLEEYQEISEFGDLLDVGLDIQDKIINTCIELRVRAQTVVIRYLQAFVNNSVPYSDYEEHIQNLAINAGQQIKQIQAVREADIKAIASEWVVSNQGWEDKYNSNFNEILTTAKEAVARLQARETELEVARKQLTEAQKPHLLPGQSEQARIANAIAQYYFDLSYTLDTLDWEETETGYKLTFSSSRNGQRFITSEMLNDKEAGLPEKLKELTSALNTPKFERSERGGHWIVDIEKWHPQKKLPIEKLEADINKIWISADKFESFVKKFERVRITAGSTGGKSPTAKNLALAIMNSRKGKGKIKLYDPQHGSKKDYWNMPKFGTSHEDNLKGMKELCELIDTRRGKTNNEFILYIFDEVDNTVSNLGKGSSEFKNYLKIAIKEGSHADIGAIFIGQSADANEVPGMTHSNWNNAVQIHIGSNAGVCLDKLTTITNEEKTRLLEQYRKIQEYCDAKNEQLGLDIFTDATAYRFALVVPLTGLPKFIQLPDFDIYNYDEVVKRDSASPIDKSVIEILNPEIMCPHCGSSEISKNGTTRNGGQYYTCKKCAQKPKRWLSTNSN